MKVKAEKRIKWYAVFVFLLISVTVFFVKMNVLAAPVYDSIKVETQMMEGDTETYTSISWKMDGKSYSSSVDEDTIAVSSNPAVLRVSTEESTGSYSYWKLSIDALRPGTAEITVQFRKNTVAFEVQVIGKNQAVIEQFPEKVTINKGSSFTFEKNYKITCGSYYDYVWLNDCEVTSSNPNVAKITGDSASAVLRRIYVQGMDGGTATITFTVTKEGLMKGFSKSFQVTVKEGPKASAPKIEEQVSFQPMVFSDRMFVGIKLLGGNIEYEVYRSSSKNKGYKKVGSFKKENGSSGQHYEFDDYKNSGLKPNKKYYYKVRARHLDYYYSEAWSAFSAPKEYWTAPKIIPDKKVKFSKKTQKVTIPKTKNVAGFIYTPHGVRKLGYNVFGQAVYCGYERTATTTKRAFKVKAFSRAKAYSVTDVRPYAKHKKYYYAAGYKITKKLASFKKAETSRKFI